MLIFINICIIVAIVCAIGMLSIFILGVTTNRWFKLDWIVQLFFALTFVYFVVCGFALLGGLIWLIILLLF